MAVEMAGRIELESPPAGDPDAGRSLNAIAIFDGAQWSALCPELDIASVGATPDEALDTLIQAVGEAIAFAAERHMEPGHPVPSDAMRDFLLSSRAPFVGRNFLV